MPGQVVKTLVLATWNGPAVAVLPVVSQLSLKAAAAALGAGRAVLADPAAAGR